MDDYLQRWAQNVVSRRSFQLNGSFNITGERNAHLGGRCEVASICLRVTPAECFQVYTEKLENRDELEKMGYLEAAVFGLLDVLLLTESYPLTELAVFFTKFEIDSMDSSYSAFRQAGRDAGRKILKLMRENMFKPPAK